MAVPQTLGMAGLAFQTPVDIANRALQHCGVERIDATIGFAEESKNARETSFVYDKVRRAELRRNVWRFAIRNTVLRALDTTTMLLAPAMWVAGTTYFVGSIVSDQYGTAWISRVPDNLGNDPLNSLTWEQYFGPLTVSLYDSGTSYYAGELVYTAAGDGTNRVYMSLVGGNSDNPATATAWAATATYSKDQVVTYSSVAYMSTIDLNTNQTPGGQPAAWVIGTTYALNAQVTGSDNLIYKSLSAGNVGNSPTIVGSAFWTAIAQVPWTTAFVGGTGSLKWLQIGGLEFPMGVGLSTLNIVYPLGSGPAVQDSSRNAFRLPAGFLRKAPRDPKAGSMSYLGAPSNLTYDDWRFEGNYIVSADGGPLMLRFVADTVDVTAMDDMFCEGLGARVGFEVCEPLTQSSEKLKTIAAYYEKMMGEARTVNAIEVGAEEPPLDDYIACRA